MPVLKPIRGIRLNKSHPLAHGLVGYWLLNEGSGTKVFDLSGNGNTGTKTGAVWSLGKFGSALEFEGVGSGDYVTIADADNLSFGNASVDFPFSFASWIKMNNATNFRIITKWQPDQEYLLTVSGSDKLLLRLYDHDASNYIVADSDVTLTSYEGVWISVAATYDGSGSGAGIKLYVNGSLVASTAGSGGSYTAMQNEATDVRLAWVGSGTSYSDGLIDHIMVYNRILSASEIALLYREPFRMFDRASSNLRFQISNFKLLEGTAAGTSDVSAVLGLRRGLTASTGGSAAVDGSLSIMGEIPHEIQRSWLREALFNGMTANAFKLGTSLSLGWFWVRVTGCSVLYRGSAEGSMGEIDFTNILAVSGQDEYGGGEISPPSYIPHNNGSTYFYVVRRFNSCGYQERTLAAAVKVSIGSNGELTEPQPNNIFSSKVEQVASNKIRLTWFYCPLEQGSKPVSFNVYYDDRTGQIDYENPLFSSGYKGRKFYSFQSSALEAGGYLFAIRAEDAGGIENISLARLKIQLDTLNPDAIDILRAEAV